MQITRRYTIQAAHRLPNTPKTHKCHQMHGHTYHVSVSVCGSVAPQTPNGLKGWFMDFAELDEIVERRVFNALDHSVLNDTIPNPTTENLIKWMWDRLDPYLPGLKRIAISENERSEVCLDMRPGE